MKGQCLCGHVRWESDSDPVSVHYCHCTMCRRWTGSPFATLVWFRKEAVRWSGNDPAYYRSSSIAGRGHCAVCGSPICLSYDAGDEIAFTAGTVEHPEALRPTHHYGIESKLAWANIGVELRGRSTRESW